ncbi:MAG TPA: DUF4232 domain-containing protein [Acidimicrobiales bacterium]|nr:DUF4232 domain-containing protein [Acidimicrobiales bacterium]
MKGSARLAVALAAGVALGACSTPARNGVVTARTPTSVGTANGAPSTSSTNPTTTVNSPPGGRFSDCQSHQLQLTFDRGPIEASGQAGEFFKVANTSNVSCTIDGYPMIEAFGATGNQEAVSLWDGALYVIDDPGPQIVNLQPGAAAYFGVGWTVGDMIRGGSQASCIKVARVSALFLNTSTAVVTDASMMNDVCPEGVGLPELGVTAVASLSRWTHFAATP